jgi:hypothetical protein
MTGWIEPPPPQRRGTGCVGKGCLILCCLLLFLMIAGGVGIYLGMRKHSAVVHAAVWARKTHLLADEPAPVPQFETTQENIAVTKRKWADFRNATPNNTVVENTATADVPRDARSGQVELTADDLNNMIAANRHIRGKAFVSIEGNRLRVQTSIPVGQYVGGAGYYLNGDIVVESNAARSLDSSPLGGITVNGQSVPSDALDWKYGGRSLRDYLSAYTSKNGLGAIEIRDGKVIINKRSD